MSQGVIPQGISGDGSPFRRQARCTMVWSDKPDMTQFWRTLLLLTFLLEVLRVFGVPGEVRTHAQGEEFVRTRQLNRQETDPTVDPHRTFLMIGENATVSDSFLLNYTRDKGSTPQGINMVAPDLMYDPASRKLLFRSGIMREVNDISELRLGRAPGAYPNQIDFNSLLPPFAIIGQVGFESWQGGRRGYGALKAAVQGAAAADPRLNMLYLSTATGHSGRSPDGSSEYKPDKPVPHVALYPEGTLDIGYGTDPSQRPRFTTKIRGHVIVDGDIYAQRCIELPPATIHAEINR
jgi:hypothetical protein